MPMIRRQRIIIEFQLSLVATAATLRLELEQLEDACRR
jgi:hypothetical protein